MVTSKLLLAIATIGLALPAQAAPAPIVFDFEDGLQGWELNGAQRVQTQILGGEWAIFGDGMLGASISIDMDITNIRSISVEQFFAGDAFLNILGTTFLSIVVYKPSVGGVAGMLDSGSTANPGTRAFPLGHRGFEGVRTITFLWRPIGFAGGSCYPDPCRPPDLFGFIDNITFHPVPEPSTLALLAFGLVALLGSGRARSSCRRLAALMRRSALSHLRLPCILSMLLISSGSYAQELPFLVKDINAAAGGVGAQALVDVGGTLFFVGNDPNTGLELWKSDGTQAGTVLVKDIFHGASDSRPELLRNVQATLFFRAFDPDTGLELWKSDGTEAGTVLVKDIFPGMSGSSPGPLTSVNETLFFRAFDPDTGVELWKSDGTEAGTVLVKDIAPGSSSSTPPAPFFSRISLRNVNGMLFFNAFDPNTGTELWKSDGTQAGTVLVKDIVPGWGGSSPELLTNVSGKLFFSAYRPRRGRELWKSDGTEAGTVLVKDISPGSGNSSPFELTDVSGTLFFTVSDPNTGRELWKSDGTEAGTVLVKDIFPGPSSSNPGALANVNGVLFFRADDPNVGTELWKSDGTEAGTVLVKDIYPGTGHSSPAGLANFNGLLFFRASNPTTGTELWQSDGTQAGTVLVKDIYPGTGNYFSGGFPSSLRNVSGTLFFTASDPNTGRELWKSDGTEAGTVLVKDIRPGTGNSYFKTLTNVNGTLFFRAFGGIWKSDGTEAGTIPVKDISSGGLTNVNGTLFFAAFDRNTGTELWKSDGTEAGTVLVKDIFHGTSDSRPELLRNVSGTLLFRADDPNTGVELWRSDGTEPGTVLVKDIVPGAASSSPVPLTNVNETLFFRVYGKLWKSDGTEAGTVLVKNTRFLEFPTDVNGVLFFRADDPNVGPELWKSDGTEAGTVLVKDIRPGRIGSQPGPLTNANGVLFFRASHPNTGNELWKSDGTEAGTVLVKDIVPGASGSIPLGSGLSSRHLLGPSRPLSLRDVNGTVFFNAFEPDTGTELWKSDGTEAGTVLVKDIFPGTSSSNPEALMNMNGTLFFRASHPNTGNELWKSDGTEAGTVLVKDIRPGTSSSDPELLTNANGTLFFAADDGVRGRELWALPPCGDGALNPGEECDDNNTDNCDGCSAACTVEEACACLGGDTDGDTLCDEEDPCKFFPNALPLVISGATGIPDECLCGDFDGDGFHSATDATAIAGCAAFLRFDCISERDEVAPPINGFYSATDASLINRVAAFIDPAYTLECGLRPEGTCGGDTGVSCF